MLSKLLTFLTAACNALAGWLQWRRRAEAKARRQAITEAVHGGDVDEVTARHHDLLRLLPLLLLPLVGCARTSREVIIVNQPMAPVRLIHEGAPGWWLSDALYEATLLKLDELKERNDE